MKEKEIINKYYECSCTCSIIRMKYFGDGEFYFSFFKSPKDKFNIIHRIQHIIHILRYGEPYDDMIILEKKDAKRLVKDIKDLIEK